MIVQKASLVLKRQATHAGDMNSHTNTSSRRHGLRSIVRRAWHEQVAAHRALLRMTPYFDAHRDDGR